MRRIKRTLKILNKQKLHGEKSFFFGCNHIFLLLISIVFLSTAAGINIVSLPLVLYTNKISTSLIGITTASDIFCGIAIIYFLHKLGRKLGIFNSIFMFGIIASTSVLLLPFYKNFTLWILLSFALATAIFSIQSLQSAWVNITIKNKIRSMIIAISSSALCLGFAIGPIIVKFAGAGSYVIFVISAICTLLSTLILLPIRKIEPKLIIGNKLRLMVFVKRNPKLIVARFLSTLQCETLMFFTVIYGIQSNMSAENSGLLVSIFSLMGIFDFLIGFLINQKTYQKLILWSFIGFLIAIITLPFAIQNFYLATLLYLILGWITSLAAICCWYGANLKRNKNQLIFINSSFVAIGLFGGFFGNLLVGFAMEIFGKEGFVIVIIAASLAYFALNFLPFNNRRTPSKAAA